MGKAARFACIFLPMAMTLASLICIIIVGVGGTNKGSKPITSLYFFKADTSELNAGAGLDLVPGTDVDNDVLKQGLDAGKNAVDLKDIYTVSLWNYCAGSETEGGAYEVEKCSKRKTAFWFNPLEVWGLEDTPAAEAFPKELDKGLKTYQKVSGWMFWAYVIAFVATIVEIVVGIFAVCSRWGSLATTIVSTVSSLFIFAASCTATVLFSALLGSFETYLKDYGIKGSLGKQMFVTTWLATAFSFGAGIFWLVSTCCVSGRSDKKKTKVERTPYTYERVASPYMGQPAHSSSTGPSSMPMRPLQNPAYEPYRRDHV
ncbi:MAG: hypothetical protein M1837_002345 [Sclerophora amabilis]|nr:MAG: hypothetical protein M1837_002345 [Sclerophora amabilis]